MQQLGVHVFNMHVKLATICTCGVVLPHYQAVNKICKMIADVGELVSAGAKLSLLAISACPAPLKEAPAPKWYTCPK